MTEHDYARDLAEKVLDRHNADPDDDLATLSRQLLRADEEIARLKAADEQWEQYELQACLARDKAIGERDQARAERDACVRVVNRVVRETKDEDTLTHGCVILCRGTLAQLPHAALRARLVADVLAELRGGHCGAACTKLAALDHDQGAGGGG